MIDFSHSIYRDEAVRQYSPDREWRVPNQLVAPPLTPGYAVVLFLIAVALLGAWLTEVPVYASGSAVVVAGAAAADEGQADVPVESDVLVVAFVPSNNLDQLRVGQTMWLSQRATGERIGQAVVAAAPEVRSPNATRQRFGLTGGAAEALTGPVAITVAQFAPQPRSQGLPPDAYVGGAYDAVVKTGSRRVLTLLPLLEHVGE
jgi:hypothetical protein